MKLKHISFFFVSITFSGINAYSQAYPENAKTLYEQASDLYESTYNDFEMDLNSTEAARNQLTLGLVFFPSVQQSEDYLSKAISLVGRNPKTLYLLIKLRYLEEQGKKWLASKDAYNTILKDIDEFVSKIDKSTYPQDKYDEIVKIKTDIEANLQLPQIKNQITFTSKEQAINYITTVLSDVRNYNFKVDDGEYNITSISAKWDGQNTINVFAYIQNPVGVGDKYCEYYAAVMDITELQRKDTVEYKKVSTGKEWYQVIYNIDDYGMFQYKYRSHGYLFPKNAVVSKLISASDKGNFNYPKYNKQIQSLQDMYAKIDKKYITQCNYAFDIFLNLYTGSTGRDFDFADDNRRYLDFKMNYRDDYEGGKRDKYFRENYEVNYLKAWDYLYNNK